MKKNIFMLTGYLLCFSAYGAENPDHTDSGGRSAFEKARALFAGASTSTSPVASDSPSPVPSRERTSSIVEKLNSELTLGATTPMDIPGASIPRGDSMPPSAAPLPSGYSAERPDAAPSPALYRAHSRTKADRVDGAPLIIDVTSPRLTRAQPLQDSIPSSLASLFVEPSAPMSSGPRTESTGYARQSVAELLKTLKIPVQSSPSSEKSKRSSTESHSSSPDSTDGSMLSPKKRKSSPPSEKKVTVSEGVMDEPTRDIAEDYQTEPEPMPRLADLVDPKQIWGLDLGQVQKRFEKFDPVKLAHLSEVSKDIHTIRSLKARLNEIMVELGKLYQAQQSTQIELSALEDRIKLTWGEVCKLYKKERTKQDKSGIIKELLGLKLVEDQVLSTTQIESGSQMDPKVKIDEATWKAKRKDWEKQRDELTASLKEIKASITNHLFTDGPNDPIYILGKIQDHEERVLGILGCHHLTLEKLKLLPPKRKLTSLPIPTSAPIDLAADLGGVPKLRALINMAQPWGLDLGAADKRQEGFRGARHMASKDLVSTAIHNLRNSKARLIQIMDQLRLLVGEQKKLRTILDDPETKKTVKADAKASLDSVSAGITQIISMPESELKTGANNLFIIQTMIDENELKVLDILGFYGLTAEHLDRLPARENASISELARREKESLTEPVQEEKKSDLNSDSKDSSAKTTGEEVSDEEVPVGEKQQRQRSLTDSQSLKEEGETPQVKVHLRRSSSLPASMPHEGKVKTGTVSGEPTSTESPVSSEPEALASSEAEEYLTSFEPEAPVSSEPEDDHASFEPEAPVSSEAEDDLTSFEPEAPVSSEVEASASAIIELPSSLDKKVKVTLEEIKRKILKNKKHKISRAVAMKDISIAGGSLEDKKAGAILDKFLADHPDLKLYVPESKVKKSKKQEKKE